MPYPDGKIYLKMGCNTTADDEPETLAEVQDWFRQGNSELCLPAMTRAVRSILPGVEFRSIRSGRCIVTYTPSGYPIVDRLADHLVVATGGNGSGAKGSDTLGYLAALTAAGESWPADIPADLFRLPFSPFR